MHGMQPCNIAWDSNQWAKQRKEMVMYQTHDCSACTKEVWTTRHWNKSLALEEHATNENWCTINTTQLVLAFCMYILLYISEENNLSLRTNMIESCNKFEEWSLCHLNDICWKEIRVLVSLRLFFLPTFNRTAEVTLDLRVLQTRLETYGHSSWLRNFIFSKTSLFESL
jgi:hypothetical protein